MCKIDTSSGIKEDDCSMHFLNGLHVSISYLISLLAINATSVSTVVNYSGSAGFKAFILSSCPSIVDVGTTTRNKIKFF